MKPAIRKEELARIVIGVDPAVTSEPGSDRTGIIIAGLGLDNHGYILKDLTCKATPDAWARVVSTAYTLYSADKIVAEANNGGLLVESVLKAVNPNLPVRLVHAARGKITRADPISALYEQGLIHHCGEFPELEDELCSWFPGMKSPDRLDACVWALWELFPENLVLGLLDLFKSGRVEKLIGTKPSAPSNFSLPAAVAMPRPGTRVTQPPALLIPQCPACASTALQKLPMAAQRCIQCGHQWFPSGQPEIQRPLLNRNIRLED